jgi:hypothetical protein
LEDDFFGVQFRLMDKSTSIFKMAKTGLLKDNECEV